MPASDIRRHPTIRAGLRLCAIKPATLEIVIQNTIENVKSTRVSKAELENAIYTLRFGTRGIKFPQEVQDLKDLLKHCKDLWYIPNQTIAMSATPGASIPTMSVVNNSQCIAPQRISGHILPPLAHTRPSSSLEPIAPAPSILNLLHSSRSPQLVNEGRTQYQQPCDIRQAPLSNQLMPLI